MNTSKIIHPNTYKTFNIMNRENKDVKYRKLVLFPVCDYLVLVIFLPHCPVPSQCQPLPTSDIGRSLSLQEVPTLASPAKPSPAQPSPANVIVV